MPYVDNDFNGAVKIHYAEAVEDSLELTLTAMDFAEMVDIPNGVTKKIPNIKMSTTGDYVKYTDQTISPREVASEEITIDTTPMVNFAIDPIDEQDNYINIKPELVSEGSYKLKERIDGDFFNKATQAKWKYDANGFGVNAGTLSPVTLVTGASQNYSTVFGLAKAGLVATGVNGDKLMLGVDPNVPVGLMTVGMETNGDVASTSYTRGFKGKFGGIQAYEVSTLTSSTVLDFATNATDGDYIYVRGVKFTARANPALAGEFDIGISADATAANIILVVNGTGTPGVTTYIQLSDDDRSRMEGVTAIDGTDLITFTSKRGALMASSSMTAAANDFRAQTVNAILMQKGAIKLAMRGVFVEERKETRNLAVNTFIYARYGLKVTLRGSEKMCVIAIQNLPAEA